MRRSEVRFRRNKEVRVGVEHDRMAHRHRLSSPLFKALLSSSVVYVAPVNYYDFGTHFWCSVLLSPKLGDTFGVCVWIAYLIWTILLQALLAVGLYFLYRRATRLYIVPIATIILYVVMVVPLNLGAVWLDARVVPFIYREAEGPSIEGQESCRVEHAHLLAPQESRYGFLERSARAWIVSHTTKEPMILLPEACRTLAYTASQGGEDELRTHFGPEPEVGESEVSFDEDVGLRYALFDKRVASNYRKTWTFEYGSQFTPTSIMFQRQYAPRGCVIYRLSLQESQDVPHESGSHCPVLSGDSDSLGSLERTAYSVSERRVEIAAIHGESTLAADISKVGPGFVVLEGISVDRRRLLIRRESARLLQAEAPDLEAHGFSNEYSEIAFDGQVIWRLPRIGEADDAELVADAQNWVWWQSKDRKGTDCCVLEWSVGGSAGSHRVARGRKIVAVSLNPTGKLIAVSVSDRHWTGKVHDSVYVIRTRDGVEVFRQYLPPLSQSRVQFLGPLLLAYTDFDGSDGFVRVVKVPASTGEGLD